MPHADLFVKSVTRHTWDLQTVTWAGHHLLQAGGIVITTYLASMPLRVPVTS